MITHTQTHFNLFFYFKTRKENRKMSKRKRTENNQNYPSKKKRKVTEDDTKRSADFVITEEFLSQCEEEFHNNRENSIVRNAICTVGSTLATTNSIRLNEISHVFLNSLKPKHCKATNQGASGRCWAFAGLNIFRNLLMRSLDLENFEFSQTYLFFWDKFERANTYLLWFIDHPQFSPDSREFDFMTGSFLGDGGMWNYFTTLVEKYGLVPKSCMKETFQSEDSQDLNKIYKEQLDCGITEIIRLREKGKDKSELLKIRENTLKGVYNTLVKFLGHPPQKFNWTFTRDGEEPQQVDKMTPMLMKELVTQGMDLSTDFVVLMNNPNQDYYKKYTVRYCKNIQESQVLQYYNVPVDVMLKYTVKSIEGNIPVWFAGDVSQNFNHYFSSLDDELDDYMTAFDIPADMSKKDRVKLRDVEGNHAMMICGFDQGKISSFQVENSWGYADSHETMLDGFLYMSKSWFDRNVTEVVIHRKFLTRTDRKKLETCPEVVINPWEDGKEFFLVGGRGGRPYGYRIRGKEVK